MDTPATNCTAIKYVLETRTHPFVPKQVLAVYEATQDELVLFHMLKVSIIDFMKKEGMPKLFL